MGVILAGGAIIYALNPQNLHEKVGFVGPYVQYFFLAILIATIAKRSYDIRLYAKKELLKPKKSIKEAYIETSFLKPSRRSRKKKKGSLGELLTASTFILLVTVAVLPYAVGEVVATDRSNFSELVTPAPEKGLKTVVIGQSSDGYIIKSYNIEKAKYESGWGVYKEDVVKFRPIDVKSLNAQTGS